MPFVDKFFGNSKYHISEYIDMSFNIDSDTVCVHVHVCGNTSTAASEWTSTDKAYVDTLKHLNGLAQTRHMWKH